MSPENSPVLGDRAARDAPSAPVVTDANFWNALIDEAAAADFLDLSVRSMQGFRYRGRGPPFVRISSRCVKYRRIDCREWAEARIRTSTSDRGQEAKP